MPFEASKPFTPALLRGEIDAFVREVDGIAPTTLIRADQDFEVRLAWAMEGELTPYVCGSWCVRVFLESIGPGAELELPLVPLHIPFAPAVGRNDYTAVVEIPAGLIPVDTCGSPYKLVASVAYLTPQGKPGPMAGYVEGPILHFYQVNP